MPRNFLVVPKYLNHRAGYYTMLSGPISSILYLGANLHALITVPGKWMLLVWDSYDAFRPRFVSTLRMLVKYLVHSRVNIAMETLGLVE